jgi:hypothetical protein
MAGKGAQGLWAGRGFYCSTRAVTRDLCFPVSSERLPHLVAFYDPRGDVEDLSYVHLLWQGASVFPVSSEGPHHSVDSYNTQGVVDDLF